MKNMFTNRTLRLLAALLLLPAALFIGCQKTAATGPDLTDGEVTNEDIAISVANLICEESGGTLDQIGDILEIISTDIQNPPSKTDPAAGVITREAVYDSVLQIWTIHVEKERGTPADSIYSKFSRTYTMQLYNAEGTPQQYWITDGDTASAFDVDIVDGTGVHYGPHISHQLTALDGSWHGTGADTPIITINGIFHRAALDSLFRPRGTRISDHAVSLTLTDVTGPRGSRINLTRKVSGTVTGQFTADVEIIKENVTITKHIVKDISIDLSASHTRIKVGPQWFFVHPGSGEVSGS